MSTGDYHVLDRYKEPTILLYAHELHFTFSCYAMSCTQSTQWTDYYRPQRLERLLDCWCRLIEERFWFVGPEGAQETTDTFKDAGTARWRDYVIPPTW